MTYKIVKHPTENKYMALINPIGDENFGFLGWDMKKSFKTKKSAIAWAKKQRIHKVSLY